MTTSTNDIIQAGDVLELPTEAGETMTALVLLATDKAVILDACDGSTPFVLKAEELVGYRKFEPTS